MFPNLSPSGECSSPRQERAWILTWGRIDRIRLDGLTNPGGGECSDKEVRVSAFKKLMRVCAW